MMFSLSSQSPQLKLSLPPTIWLEPDQIEQAQTIAHLGDREPQQWQLYLQTLAQLAFASWLQDQLPETRIERLEQPGTIGAATYLQIDRFTCCLVATEHVLEDGIAIPGAALAQPDCTAHFYVVLEVLEEDAQVVVRGFLRYDELMTWVRQVEGQINSQTNDQINSQINGQETIGQETIGQEAHWLPLAVLDTEIDHLGFYVRHVTPDALLTTAPTIVATPSPTLGENLSEENPIENVVENSIEHPIESLIENAVEHPIENASQPPIVNQSTSSAARSRLSQWLQGRVDEAWQALDRLINPEASMAWSTRHLSAGTKGGKLINFGVQLGQQSVALVVTVKPETAGKIGVSIQVLPVAGEIFLPDRLNLALLSRNEEVLQEVSARAQDNYIQLRSFKGTPGTPFYVELTLDQVKIREAFEL